MALKGNLRDVGLKQLFNLIHLAHKTGVLTLQSDNGASAACLYFKEGRLIQADVVGQQVRLTDILVQAGKITPEQASAIRSRSRVDTDKELGLLMIQSGAVNQNDIVQAVRTFFLEIVYGLFTWPGGTFRFDANQLPPADRITVAIDLDHLIIEGGHRVQEWEQLRDEMPSLDVALRFTERPNANMRSINLTVDQWKVISFINSRTTVHQIATYLKMDEFQVRKVVQSLRTAGLVDVIAAPQPAAAPTSPRPVVAPPAPLKPVPAAGPSTTVHRSVLMRVINRILRL